MNPIHALYLMDILNNYTDENHSLSQKEIRDILKKEYDITIERKSLGRTLQQLRDVNENIITTGITRKNKNGEEGQLISEIHVNHTFTNSELRLLIDSLLFSKSIPPRQCKDLIEKIQQLSSKYFKANVRHVCALQEDKPVNRSLFNIIDILDEAIENEKQVSFTYGDYGLDMKLHERLDKNGNIKKYIVNPYQMVTTNGRYYLICNNDAYDEIAHFRVDHIMSIENLQTPVKPIKNVKGLEHGLNLPKHMAEHVYMFSGESKRVSMETSPDMIGELIDWFGKDVTFTNVTDDSLTAHVTVNTRAMKYWALQYAPYVKITEPKPLADEIKADLKSAFEKY